METETSPLQSGTGKLVRADSRGWTAAWLQPEIRGDLDVLTHTSRILTRGSFAVFKVVEESVNPKGLGALRLYHAAIPMSQGYDPDSLAGYLADSVRAPGSQIELSRYGLRQLAEELPVYEDVQQEADAVLQDLAALDSIYQSSYLYPGNYQAKPNWEHRLVFPVGGRRESYGLLWVPRNQTERLVLVEPTERNALDATHLCVDALASKHRLFEKLGFGHLIERDRERIDRWLANQAERAA